MMFYNMLTWLGLFLLYMPPTIVFLLKDVLKKYEKHISLNLIVSSSIALYLVMMFLLPEAWIAFTTYLFAFVGFFWYISAILQDKALGLRLSLYICFIVSVLWEIPIQLIYPQNPDALMMVSLKAMSIPLFLYEIRQLGFKFHKNLIPYFGYTFLIGVVFTCLFYIYPLSIYNDLVFTSIHLYRLPWFIILLSMINITSKQLYNEVELTFNLFKEVMFKHGN